MLLAGSKSGDGFVVPEGKNVPNVGTFQRAESVLFSRYCRADCGEHRQAAFTVTIPAEERDAEISRGATCPGDLGHQWPSASAAVCSLLGIMELLPMPTETASQD